MFEFERERVEIKEWVKIKGVFYIVGIGFLGERR